tara:strand:- start:620 stop:796 length:177 start_codon:yes stop_codon:yes gene_type:complete
LNQILIFQTCYGKDENNGKLMEMAKDKEGLVFRTWLKCLKEKKKKKKKTFFLHLLNHK